MAFLPVSCKNGTKFVRSSYEIRANFIRISSPKCLKDRYCECGCYEFRTKFVRSSYKFRTNFAQSSNNLHEFVSFVWLAQVRTPALTRTVQVSFVFCLLFFKWSGRVKLWYPAPWVGNTNVPHSAERKGELACVSRFLTYVMASSRMGDHGRTHKGQANEICARGVRIFCRCMRPPKS